MKRRRGLLVLAAALAAGVVWILWPQPKSTLVLYSALTYGGKVAQAFTARTGIPVTVVDLSTGALLARVSAEGRHPAWTMIWFDGDLAAEALDRSGLLARGIAPELAWTSEGRAMIPPDRAYVPTGLTLAGVFTAKAGPLPGRWKGLSDWKGVIGMNNPAISGPTYPLLAGMIDQGGGWPAGQAYVLALKTRGLRVYAKNADTLAALRAGDISLAVTQSTAAAALAAKDPTLAVAVPDPAFALPSVAAVAVDASPELRAQAQAFIRFAMSPEIQAMRMAQGGNDGYYWPVTLDAPAPPTALPRVEALKLLPPATWGPLQPEITAWFSKAIVEK